MQSYVPLMTVGSVKDARLLHNTIDDLVSSGMFFMREHVLSVGTTSTTSTAAASLESPPPDTRRF
jgi:hypothetical protein